MTDLKDLCIAVLATDGFEESELISPVQAFREAGAQVNIIAPHGGEIQALRHMDKGSMVAVDVLLNDADPMCYDALHLPGGVFNADELRVIPAAQEFVCAFDQIGKPISAICHAPWLLVSAGLVRGRRLTSYYTISDDIENAGGDWVDEALVENDNWVTSRKPSDLPLFNPAAIALFASLKQQRAA